MFFQLEIPAEVKMVHEIVKSGALSRPAEPIRKPAKQTAGNNALLRSAKRVWNAKVYARTAAILNAEGEAAAVAYLQQFVTVPVIEHMAEMVAYLDARKANRHGA